MTGSRLTTDLYWILCVRIQYLDWKVTISALALG